MVKHALCMRKAGGLIPSVNQVCYPSEVGKLVPVYNWGQIVLAHGKGVALSPAYGQSLGRPRLPSNNSNLKLIEVLIYFFFVQHFFVGYIWLHWLVILIKTLLSML